jgi:hypothetical protein
MLTTPSAPSFVGYSLRFTESDSLWIDRWRQLIGVENEHDESVTWRTPDGNVVERTESWTLGMEVELARVEKRLSRDLEALALGWDVTHWS